MNITIRLFKSLNLAAVAAISVVALRVTPALAEKNPSAGLASSSLSLLSALTIVGAMTEQRYRDVDATE